MYDRSIEISIFELVQARSINTIKSGSESEMSKKTNEKQQFPIQYADLLRYLMNHQKTYDDNDVSSSSTEDVKLLPKRGFFLFPDRRSSQKHRPTYTYGRKSHWDTFFG
jgi:hypothetical protein